MSWRYIDDRDIAVGERYEYEAGGQYLLAGLRAAPVEPRGKVILLVDETLAPSLESELETLKIDLVGDGWTVIRKDVPRHDDTDWSRNGRNVAMIKSFITEIYRADRGELPAKAVFVLGHVAIPYSGAGAEDGHPDHAGAWPADLFYGDVDGQWTDERAHRERPANLRLQNLAGDGKFDQGMVPTNETGVAAIELAVGRVDLSRLPAFSSQSEVQLVRQYLDKNHRFRHGQLSFGARTIVGSYFDNALDRAMHCQAWRNGSRLFGFDPSTVIEGDLFVRRLSCLWGIQGGYANSSSINTVSGVNRKLGTFNHSVRDLAKPGGDPLVGLYALAGSYFGDWDTPDNLLRATLALPRSGLAAMWAHQIDWHFETAALGEPLGVGLLQTVRQNPLGPSRTITLLGDPTLRLTVTPPPANLNLRRDGDSVVLRWDAAPQSDVRYRVYRAASINAPFTPLTPGGITGNSFTTRNAAEKLYQVRAASLVVTASGSFTNLSQGVFINAR